ncbi:MAG: cation:proton antiporter, partial [Myxococcales bacterium]|nr:cation:proton antiporter [Myxococcales bacterium]
DEDEREATERSSEVPSVPPEASESVPPESVTSESVPPESVPPELETSESVPPESAPPRESIQPDEDSLRGRFDASEPGLTSEEIDALDLSLATKVLVAPSRGSDDDEGDEAQADDETHDGHGDDGGGGGDHGHGEDGGGGDHGDGGHGDGGHGHGDGGHGHGNAEGATLVQFGIVVLLVGMMWLLHRFGGPSADVDYDPTAMLALGFVVLASYTIGSLVDVVRLPHITGYLLAGLVFGSSIAHSLGLSRFWAPFDEGVVHEGVIRQLKPLETLAVALIAISAGGELKVDTLRTGLKPILGVLGGQLLAVLAVITGFIYLVSGPIEWLVLPGLGPLGPDAVIPIGLTVAAVSFATSPSATLAVINETGARGPMSRTVLSSVVLKDVFVVILFGVFSAWALQSLGNAGEGSLAKQLAIEIFGSVALGIGLGAAIAIYLRFVGRELMLFVLGVVYTGTLVATEAHLDGVIVFLTAGFVVSNFSRQGENLLHTVEALSMPTYVVFFTLAGAKLHLDEVFGPIGAFGVALVLLRVGAIYLGTRFGGAIGGAKGTTQRYGWMGFVSQAGVAITLAGFVKQRFGEAGEALGSLIIAGVAINEVAGPVMLKTALGLAGETRKSGAKKKTEEAERPSRPRESELDRPSFHPWPDEASKVDWGERIKTGAPRLDRALRELEIDLRTIVREVGDGPMIAFREDAERYLRELRREFLRHHRRLVVKAREIDPSATDDGAVASRQALALALRTEQTELSERWRSVVLARSAALAKGGGWTPQGIAETLDDVVAALPERVEVPWDPRIFETKPGDKLPLRTRRALLRARRRTAKLFGKEMAPRSAELRELARYHLEYRTPPRLEGVAALFVSAEQHLAG